MKLGAQLYTVRPHLQDLDSFAESLKKVRDIGFTVVQVSGACPYEPEWLKEQLDKNDLICVLTHSNHDRMMQEPEKVAEEHKIFGCRYLGIGSAPGVWTGMNQQEFAEKYIPLTQKLKAAGCIFAYHNHSVEFTKYGGVPFLHGVWELMPHDSIVFTLDTYWLQMGGCDPAEWIEKFSGQVPCIHLKDLEPVHKESRMAPVGQGNLNFDKILAAAEKAGNEYLLVEQDHCYDDDPFECLKKSFEYLKARGLQ